LEWASLFADAIAAARDGVAQTAKLAAWVAGSSAEVLRRPGLARMYAGGNVSNPALAKSFEVIARNPRDFYEGPLAKEVCPQGSPLAPDDLAAYRANWIDPISTAYRGHELVEMPPPTQGVAPLAIANMLEGFDVAAMGEGTAAHFHYMAEATKLAYADRDAFITDPKFEQVPVAAMIDKVYAARRRALIRADRALTEAEVAPGLPARHARRSVAAGDTCYFCTADRDGMAVSIIQSLYFDFGSAELGGDTGIILQNRGSFFSLDENHPNRLEPGKRTFHTLIPAMLIRDGKPWAVFGAMGGEGQPQSQAALLTRMIDFGMDPQAAITAPRFLLGRTWGEATAALAIERRVGEDIARELQRLGHPVMLTGAFEEAMGHAQAIKILDDGSFEGGADPRGDGAAVAP
jgi:gamma-glutamyltranspeptidase/glutathione hydrolase